MLKDYLHKIEKLSTEQLSDLAEKYRDTIRNLQKTKQEASVVAFTPTVNYTEEQLAQKQAELEIIEKLLIERGKK